LILGGTEGLEAISNTGLSTPDLAELIARVLAGEPPERPLFIFVDVAGGSCALACSEVLRSRPATRLFTGVNLPMIIGFLQYRETTDPEALAAGILLRGQRGIAVFPAPAAVSGGAAPAAPATPSAGKAPDSGRTG
jgi:mannose/fructose-specific phosphotransferase system component IIA